MAANYQDSYAQLKTSKVLSGIGQRLVTLSDTNKDALLSESTQVIHSNESRARATVIRSRLGDLNPEVGRQFHPKQDALSGLNLRMICSGAQSDPLSAIDQVSSYVAVSYCWHYSQWPLAPAATATPLCPGWEISRPMMDAVMALRLGPDEGVWLDKLCINQDDQADKAAHIGIMDVIYRSARRVAILLEDVQLKKDEEEAGLAYKGFYADLCREVKDAGLEGEEKSQFIDEYFPRREQNLRNNNKGHILAAAPTFALKVLGARWYSRGWCAHESRMTKNQKVNNPLLLCFGSDGRVLSFEFRFIHYLGLYLSDLEPGDTPAGPEFIDKLNDPNPKTLRQLWWRIQRLMPNRDEGVSAMQHLVSIMSFGCFKKGDLMSIALNTAGIPLYFDGEDMSYVEEVVWEFSLLVLASGDLIPLVANGRKLKVPTNGGNVISWATNPSQGVLENQLRNPLPESITAITREYIELDLLVFESTPQHASLGSQAKATRLIEDHNLDAIADEVLPTLDESTQHTIRLATTAMTDVKPGARPLQTLRHQLLSLALDNGLDWILDFPRAMQQATATTFDHGTLGVSTDPRLSAVADSLLALFNTTTTAAAAATSPDTATPTQQQKTMLSLATLLDPRLFLFTANIRRLPLPPSLGTAVLTPATSNRSYIAVPAVLAHLPAWHSRAWVVEPFDPAAAGEEHSNSSSSRADYLPPADLRVAAEGEHEDKIEDVVPVLSSDYEDRRAPRDDGRATWRMRRQQVLYGGWAPLWGPDGTEMLKRGEEVLVRGGEGVVLLRKQRVYGCEDYPWGEIREALERVFGRGSGGETGTVGVGS
ncbi:heterokaryon incompatibility protein-domain-containing protein [Chaetomidium leptoderma]|uniref:Heterokaryon incompatibility protein-domain-containing protein n=1 Tax=Chaetomidium leptoderma TaxID=669021 RepID=A0AAN6VLI2_9PEZI|nr:heterokaryon incompatibility protein-domain-containing protein [Chaetomidium leptoderma]